jgi:ubiquinone/menaquinone biosynthesis C-methylase UbiE
MQPTPEEWNTLFNKAAPNYEKQSAGVTRVIGQKTLPLLPPITTDSVVHDNACGPGVITFDIIAQCSKDGIDPPTIYATDLNKAMIDVLQNAIDAGNLKTVTAQVMDGSDLSQFHDDEFTHSITNFGIFAFPDPVAGVKHIFRTLKPGGVAAITTWKYPGNIFFVNEVLQELAPGREEWFPVREWTQEATLRGILEEGGFNKSKVEFLEKSTLWNIEDFDATVELFNGPFWDYSKSGLTEEQKAGWLGGVKTVLKARNGKGIDMIAWVAIARK